MMAMGSSFQKQKPLNLSSAAKKTREAGGKTWAMFARHLRVGAFDGCDPPSRMTADKPARTFRMIGSHGCAQSVL